jgi:hypothetical protein
MDIATWISAAALVVTILAARSALRSQDEAKRSADAAEASVELQRQEAALAKKAYIDAHSWESRARRPNRGLVIQNVGRGVAKNIRALVWSGGEEPVQAYGRTSLGPTDGAVGLLDVDTAHPVTDKEARQVTGIHWLEQGTKALAVRISWLNEDEPSSEWGDWKSVPRNS